MKSNHFLHIFMLTVLLTASFWQPVVAKQIQTSQRKRPPLFANAGIVVTPVSGLVTTENGDQSSFTVKLANQPFFNVTISLESSDPGEGTVQPTKMTFNKNNWNTEKTAVVTGQDDQVVDGDQSYEVKLTATSGDWRYRISTPMIVSIINQDNDTQPVVSAQDDIYRVNKNETLQVQAPGVLRNDTVTDGYQLQVQLVSNVAHGSLTLNGVGSFDYHPDQGFVGADSFKYRAVVDGNPQFSGTATATINVNDTNSPPTAANDAYSTDENSTLEVSSKDGLLANDTDPDTRDHLTVSLIKNVMHGNLDLSENGSFRYKPIENYNGSDQFTYRASDGKSESNIATVKLTIHAGNQAPTANDDYYLINATNSIPFTVVAPGLLSNDTDPENKSLTASVLSQPENGSLTLNVDGSFTYTPQTDFNGLDTFTYQVEDGSGGTDSAIVQIEVDTTPPPAVIWVLPDIDGSINSVNGGDISLEVTVDPSITDLDHITFYRWDPILNQRLEIATKTKPPYTITLDSSTLVYGWNQVDAAAFDKAGNHSLLSHIWVVRNFPPQAYLPLIYH